ncbi:flippase [Bifidobacterium thermacidophilum]|nr:flippase [Bifidobacterium thermacidophilum]
MKGRFDAMVRSRNQEIIITCVFDFNIEIMGGTAWLETGGKCMAKSVKINAILNVTLSASSMLVSVITIPYVTRALSVSGYGDVNFAQSISSWLNAFCVAGIPTYGIRECAKVRDDKEQLATLVRELLRIITICTVVVLGLFAIAILVVPRLAKIAPLMWMFLVSTLLQSYGVEWYFQALEDYRYITIRSIIFKIISLIAIFLFVRHSGDYIIYGGILALVTCGNNVFNIIRLRKEIGSSGKGALCLTRHVKALESFALLNIASAVYLSFDTTLLGFCSPDNSQVALYQLASKIKNAVFAAVLAVINTLVSRLSYYFAKEQQQYYLLLKRATLILVETNLGVACFLAVFAKEISILVSSEKYINAAMPLRIVAFAGFLSSINAIIGFCILTPMGREKRLAIANTVGVPVSLVLNLALDWSWGAVGAAVAVLVSEGCIFIVQFASSIDVFHSLNIGKDIMKSLLCNLVPMLLSIFCEGALPVNISGSSEMSSFIVICVGLLVYLLTWLLVSSVTKSAVFCYVKNIIANVYRRISGK